MSKIAMMLWNKKQSTGVFELTSTGQYEEFKGDIGSGSINAISLAMGHQPSQLHTVILFDKPNGIHHIAVLPLTRIPVFVHTDRTITKIRKPLIKRLLGKIDWEMEYDPAGIDFMLDDAIEDQSWTLEFMQRIFSDVSDSVNQVFLVKTIGYYLIVSEGFLIDYTSADGLSKWGKQLNELNPFMVQCWLDEGMLLHGEKERAISYVNLQADAWASLVGSMNHPAIPEYTRKDGSIDFYLIGVNEDERAVNTRSFETRIGKARGSRKENEKEQFTYTFQGKTCIFIEDYLHAIF